MVVYYMYIVSHTALSMFVIIINSHELFSMLM